MNDTESYQLRLMTGIAAAEGAGFKHFAASLRELLRREWRDTVIPVEASLDRLRCESPNKGGYLNKLEQSLSKPPQFMGAKAMLHARNPKGQEYCAWCIGSGMASNGISRVECTACDGTGLESLRR